jgi:hypothetical protein
VPHQAIFAWFGLTAWYRVLRRYRRAARPLW